jgi:cysteine desulfurase/selenocysteine lyase
MLNIQAVRNDFTILANDGSEKPYIYLDSAATALTPKDVVNVITNYYNEVNASIFRGFYAQAIVAEELVDSARTAIAAFIGADSEEIIFTQNASDASNLLVDLLFDNNYFSAQDKVLVCPMDHHSNYLPWQRLRRIGVDILYMGFNDTLQYDTTSLKKFLSLNGNKVKFVVVSAVSNVTGIVNDIKTIANIVHQYGVQIVVDATQAVPHMPINVREWGVDYLFYSGHKLPGPMGIGVLYGQRVHLLKLAPHRLGGGMVGEVTPQNYTYVNIPHRFEVGTVNVPGILGLEKAVQYINTLGWKNITDYEEELRLFCNEKICQRRYFNILGTDLDCERIPLFSFTIDGIDGAELCSILDQRYNIAIRNGNMCAQLLLKDRWQDGVNRISPYFYNTTAELEVFFKALDDIVESYQI